MQLSPLAAPIGSVPPRPDLARVAQSAWDAGVVAGVSADAHDRMAATSGATALRMLLVGGA